MYSSIHEVVCLVGVIIAQLHLCDLNHSKANRLLIRPLLELSVYIYGLPLYTRARI